MRLPRFRLRTLMIAVVVAALVLVAEVEFVRLRQIAHERRQKAAEFANTEKELRGIADGWEACARAGRGPESYRQYHKFSMLYSLRADRFARLRRRHERAARSPWTHLTPDPPEPDLAYLLE
jgi:hypothetical protein